MKQPLAKRFYPILKGVEEYHKLSAGDKKKYHQLAGGPIPVQASGTFEKAATTKRKFMAMPKMARGGKQELSVFPTRNGYAMGPLRHKQRASAADKIEREASHIQKSARTIKNGGV